MDKIDIKEDIKNDIRYQIQKYFKMERDEVIGDLAADVFLNYIIEKVGPSFYNQGVEDAHDYMYEKIEELYGLQKNIGRA